jgi:hypothetical protein
MVSEKLPQILKMSGILHQSLQFKIFTNHNMWGSQQFLKNQEYQL